LIKPSVPLLPLVCSLCLSAGTVLAQPVDNLAADDKPRLQEQARHLREDADVIRRKAETQHEAAQKLCWHKFLVSACLSDAAKALRDEKSRAHAMDKEAREIERDIRKREFAERETKRLEQAANPANSRQ
jgi:colicin import membrane protein